MDKIRNGYQSKDSKQIKKVSKTCDCKFQYKLIGVLNASYHFYIVLAIAAFGLIMNLDEFLFSIVKTLISFAVIALIIYLIYYFLFNRRPKKI